MPSSIGVITGTASIAADNRRCGGVSATAQPDVVWQPTVVGIRPLSPPSARPQQVLHTAKLKRHVSP